MVVPIIQSALSYLLSFRLKSPGPRCISPTTTTRWQTSVGFGEGFQVFVFCSHLANTKKNLCIKFFSHSRGDSTVAGGGLRSLTAVLVVIILINTKARMRIICHLISVCTYILLYYGCCDPLSSDIVGRLAQTPLGVTILRYVVDLMDNKSYKSSGVTMG